MKVQTAKVCVCYADGTLETKLFSVNNNLLTVPKDAFSGRIRHIDLYFEEFTGYAGQNGYFIIPNITPELDNQAAAKICFRKRENTSCEFPTSNMPIFAVCDGSSSLLAVCDGMQFEYSLIAEVCNGKYRLFPRYKLGVVAFYEDITIQFINVDDTDWCAIARAYREHQLNRGACLPLKERVKGNSVLEKAVKGPMVRCRLATKAGDFPFGLPLEQNEKNEPPVEPYVDFARMEKVIEELHKAGCENASFCLVGWCIGGHDGKNPDYLPPEPKLGGEEGLRKLIAKAKELGYLISAHTNSWISFSLSERLDIRDFQRNPDGTNFIWGISYGGNCHVLCDKQSYEHYVKNDMKDIGAFGFEGIHFFDQITIFEPRACYDPAHPLTKRGSAEYRAKILEAGRKTFGASSSEGGFDFCIGSYDWAMYPVVEYNPKLPAICDTIIPLWYLVYHGIVLYNAFTKTVNAMFKSPEYNLISIEHGALPLAYVNARPFEYEGEPNFNTATDEELKKSVQTMGKAYKEYSAIADLQYAFFDEHRILQDGVIYTRYSNGSVIIVNYTDAPYTYEGSTVKAKSYLRIG